MEQFKPVKRSSSWWGALGASALVIPLTACGGGSGGGSDAAAEGADCEIPQEISLIVPFGPSGGFDAWGRLLAPAMAERLGVDVIVENIAGGGGIRGINTVAAGPKDGSQVVIFSAQDVALAQTLGHTEDDFDLAEMTLVGGFTEDPQVFLVKADSEIETIEDLAEQESVLHAGEEISPIEVLTYDAFGIEPQYILHDGKSPVILSIMRGDADVTVGSLSSVLDYMNSGDMKPILYIGEEPTPDLPGHEHVQDAPTPESLGQEGFGDELVQMRVMAAAAGTPDCVADALSEALAETLEDPEFVERADAAALRVVPIDAEAAADAASESLESMMDKRDVLEAAAPE